MTGEKDEGGESEGGARRGRRKVREDKKDK